MITGLGSGGAERMLTNIVRALPDDEHFVFCITVHNHFERDLLNLGAVVHFASKPRLRVVIRELRSLAKHIEPEVVQSWLYHADLCSALAFGRRGRQLCVWGVQSGLAAGSHHGLRTLFIRRLLAALSRFSCKAIICCSQEMSHELARIGYASSRIQTIHNAVDTEQFPFVFRSDFNQVAVVPARWHPQKDHQTLLQAWSQVVERFPSAKLHLVGAGMVSSNGELMRWIDEYHVAASVELLGQQSEMFKCYASATHVVLSSSAEGLPLALCEAMSTGLVPVVTDVGEMAAAANLVGYVVPSGDPDALATAMASAFADQRSYADSSRAARERIVQSFDIYRVAGCYRTIWIRS